MLIPHIPYRFDSECKRITPKGRIMINGKRQWAKEKILYIDQLKCANKQTLKFINLIKG